MSDEREILSAALEGRYSIDRPLGEGGMAKVYLATDLRHDRPVAVKILRTELATESGRTRFDKEISSVAALRHPHVLPLIDSGEVQGYRYLITPYIEGETLAERLAREGPLPLADAISIARDVAEGIGAAHKRGLIHRDIKPSNVLLSDGHAIVADFGVVRPLDETVSERLSTSGLIVGTPLYMSPEQAGSEHPVDERSDVYSLGCVVYHMLAGEAPYVGSTVAAILARHVMHPVPDLRSERPELPVSVALAVARALAKDPSERPHGVAAFVEELTVPGASERGPPRRLLPWAFGAATAAVAVLLAVRTFVPGEGPGEEAPVTVLVTSYQNPAATDAQRNDLRAAEDELTRLLTGWDQVRAVPAASKAGLRDDPRLDATASISLDDALTLARRADASTLVALERSTAGDSAFLQAHVHDVASGALTGTPVVSAAPTGDVLGLVAPIAAAILDADMPPGQISYYQSQTSDLEAIRLQRAGERELGRNRLESAERLLRGAVARDSTFAQALYQLAMTLHWRGVGNRQELPLIGGEIRRLASAARRNAGPLNHRDSLSVEAFFAFQNGRYQEARQTYDMLIAADSTDAYAWLMLGSVEFWDPWTVAGPGGTPVPRGSLNRATEAFARAVAVDPDFYLGYGHFFEIYGRVSGAVVRLACYSFEPPGDGTVLFWETRSGGVELCPVFRDSIEMIGRDELRASSRAELLAGVERFMDVSLVELRRWADFAPESYAPPLALSQWVAAGARVRAETGSMLPWSTLVAEALPYATRALSLKPDTTPADLVWVSSLRLATGDLQGALTGTEDAIALAAAEPRAALPSETPNALLAAGRITEALRIAEALRAPSRMRIRDDEGTLIDVRVLPLFERLEIYGAAGLRGPAVAATFDSIHATWSEAGYTEAQQRALRRVFADRLSVALTLDGAPRDRWFQGWAPESPALEALAAFERAPDSARALLRAGAAGQSGLMNRRAAYLVGVLAGALGDHRLAISALSAIGTIYANPYNLTADWVLQVRAHLLLGRALEALGNTDRALREYARFVELWEGADPELADQVESARAAVARLRPP